MTYVKYQLLGSQKRNFSTGNIYLTGYPYGTKGDVMEMTASSNVSWKINVLGKLQVSSMKEIKNTRRNWWGIHRDVLSATLHTK